MEINPSDFSRTYTDVYNNSEAGENPGFARSSLDGGQAWSAKNIGDSMIIDAEEVVTLAGIITQGRFCPGPGLLEQIARSEDDCTWSAVNHECVQSKGQYAYCKPRYSGPKQYFTEQFSIFFCLENFSEIIPKSFRPLFQRFRKSAANLLEGLSEDFLKKFSSKTEVGRILRRSADDV